MPRLLCYLYQEPFIHIALYKKSGSGFSKEFVRKFSASCKTEAFSIVKNLLDAQCDSADIVVVSCIPAWQTVFASATLHDVPYLSLSKVITLHFEELIPFPIEKASTIVKADWEKKTVYVELEAVKEQIIFEEIDQLGLPNVYLGSEIQVKVAFLKKHYPHLHSCLLLSSCSQFLTAILYQDKKIFEALSIEHHGNIEKSLENLFSYFTKKEYALPSECLLLSDINESCLQEFTVLKNSYCPLDAMAHCFYAESSQALDFISCRNPQPWRKKKRVKTLLVSLIASSSLALFTLIGCKLSLASSQAKISKELTAHLPLAKKLTKAQQMSAIEGLTFQKKKFDQWQKKYGNLFHLLEQISTWAEKQQGVEVLSWDFNALPKPCLKINLVLPSDTDLHPPYDPKISLEEKRMVLCYE